jgi:hypothetical protein
VDFSNFAPIVNRSLLENVANSASLNDQNDMSFPCEANECKNLAKTFCKTCSADLCDDCDRIIHQMLNSHERIHLAEKEFLIPVCEKHQMRAKMSCISHDKLICLICLHAEHKDPCNIQGIAQFVEIKRNMIKDKMRKFAEIEEIAKIELKRVESLGSKFRNCIDKIQQVKHYENDLDGNISANGIARIAESISAADEFIKSYGENLFDAWRSNLKTGDLVDALDFMHNCWYESKILDIKDGKVFIVIFK